MGGFFSASAPYAERHPGPFGSFGVKNRDRGVSGVRRVRMPVSLTQLRLEADLLEYLQKVPLFELSEDELEKKGFSRCVDHPEVPGHHYYEGYFHGLETPSPVPSINPRAGFTMQKPAAPRELRAFIAAFKKLNAVWLRGCISGTDDASRFYKMLMDKQFHFADIAVQVHSGDAIDEAHVGWHSDAPNSTLHLALSIRGKRSLHSRLAKQISDEEMELKVHPQTTGDVYVSSPFAFPHGVEYTEAKSWEDRIVAVQIRFLLTEDDYARMRETYESLETFMDKVTCCMASGPVILPTLKQVQDAAKELKEAEPYIPDAGPSSRRGGRPAAYDDVTATGLKATEQEIEEKAAKFAESKTKPGSDVKATPVTDAPAELDVEEETPQVASKDSGQNPTS